MPNIKSAKKRVKVSAKKEEMNVLVNSTMKNAIKKTEKEIELNEYKTHPIQTSGIH